MSYRKVWENTNGPIPKDEDGRSYEIHHIDGNRNNNNIENLICISIKEHYDLHYKQGDYGACLLISERMNIAPFEKSKLATKMNNKRVKEGVHQFLGGEIGRKANEKQMKDGTNPVLQKEFHEKMSEKRQKKLKEGTHHLQSSEFQKNLHRIRKERGIDPYTKNRIPVINKSGEVKMLLREDYYAQKGDKKLWTWVTINSNEGKNRKIKDQLDASNMRSK